MSYTATARIHVNDREPNEALPQVARSEVEFICIVDGVVVIARSIALEIAQATIQRDELARAWRWRPFQHDSVLHSRGHYSGLRWPAVW